jgi:hypothetical protein
VAGTRFPCPFDPSLVCGILDHWIAELQPHSNKRDPILSRHYIMIGRSPWQRALVELLPANSLPPNLSHFCDMEHTHDSVTFNSVRTAFKDTCEHMLAKLRPVGVSTERQQELAAWMIEGLKEFAPRNDLARVGSCASLLDTSDSDLNMLMQPHDPQVSLPHHLACAPCCVHADACTILYSPLFSLYLQLFERKDGLDFLHNFSKHLKKRAKPAHFSTLMAYSCQTPYALCSRITCKISGGASPATDVDCTFIIGDRAHVARSTLLKLYSYVFRFCIYAASESN